MQKLKPLIPSMRERKRYLAYEVISKESLKKDISQEMIKLVNSTLGLFDSADSGILSVEYDSKKQKGLLKVNHKMTDKVRVGLMMIKSLTGINVLIQTIGLSGTMKKARSKYM